MCVRLQVAISLGMALLTFSCTNLDPQQDQEYFLGIKKSAVEDQLNEVIHNWYPRTIDTVNGGFWTNFEYDWTRSESQPKMLVTQARGLWTA